MIFDKQLMFSENQSLAQTAGTYYSNCIDLSGGLGTLPQTGPSGINGEIGGPNKRDVARGKPINFFGVMTEALSTGSSPTLRVYIETSDTVDGSNNLNNTIVTLYDSTALAASTFVAGYRIRYQIPFPTQLLRYMQMKFTIAVATTTTGKITAGLTFGDMIPNLVYT